MKLNFKNNFWGYFQFYYSVLGNKFLINLGLGVAVSFLDGMGLSMFMPLLQATGDGESKKRTMGELHFLTDLIEKAGFTLSLNIILIVLVILFAIKGILKFLQLNYQVGLQHLFMRRIRYKMLDDLQGLSYRGFLNIDAGGVQNTLTTEVQRLNQTVKFYFIAAQGAVMLLTYIALAILANYQFALLVAIGAAASNLLYRRIYESTKKASIGVSKKGDEFNSLLIQAIHYFKYLKSTNYFNKFTNHLRQVVHNSEILNRKMGFNAAITNSVKEPIIIVIVALVIYVEINVVHTSLTSILMSLLLFYRALTSLIIVQNFWQSFIQNVGAINSVSMLSNEMHVMREEQTTETYSGFKQSIELKNVSFAYEKRRVLDNINLVIPKNQTIALIGESGSGKTTLANMICALIKPDSGAIHIDGNELYQYNLNSFRNKIGYISQEAVVFNDTIFNNITFWAEPSEENKKRFWDIVELASLNDFILNQPQQELTRLGDNGILISGGQKQRISIARELYKKSEILILDEATSALDSETEKIIQENIEKLHGSYTMIIIAHRLSTIKETDIIYLLEQGKVSASGKFDEMLNVSERFRRMVALQEI